MNTTDNPGTLQMNLYLTVKPTSQPFDFGKIAQVQGDTTEAVVTARKERGRKELSSDLVQSSGDIVYKEIVCIAARCNHFYQKSKGDVLWGQFVRSINFHTRGGKGNRC